VGVLDEGEKGELLGGKESRFRLPTPPKAALSGPP